MKPIIDVHAHVFRGKDIPLKGYLLSRWYPEWYIRLLAPLLFAIIARCIERAPEQRKGPLCGLVLNIVYKYMGEGYRRWTEVLSMQQVGAIAQELVEAYDKDGIELYVPLVIDYEYWFKSTRETPIAHQVRLVYEEVVLPFEGKIHPFVPFDPARELAYRANLPGPADPDNGPPEATSSLEMVKDAIRNKGFIGVKIYNTLGYRPLNNAAVDEQRRHIFRKNKMDRYTVFTGEEFDEVLEEFYEFCVQEQVPITAHCNATGIEAYPGASLDFASPPYWRAVLDRFPDLHLNLAHFGWNHPEGYYPPVRWPLISRPLRQLGEAIRRRFPNMLTGRARMRGKETWVGDICAMMRDYPYQFTDVAHHGITEDENIPKYIDAYKGMCHDYPEIKKRLLFGIDWHVITRAATHREFKDRYLRVLREGNLFNDEEIADFLGGNALDFLGLLPLGTSPQEGWTKNRERLQRFYQDHSITPPDWFTSTA
jgi:hypothetical protein